jgi:hypothetical protein
MRKVPQYAVIAFALAGTCAQAQLSDLLNFQGDALEGLHLYGVNVFSSYVSSAFPVNTNVNLTPGAAQLGYDLSYGVSASAGWRYQRPDKAAISILYTGSYNESENYSSLSAFGHSLRANAAWNLTPKLVLNISGTGEYQTLAQYLFAPTGLSIIAQTPATFDDLAAAMGVGKFTNAQAASMLTGGGLASVAAPLASPATSLLVGTRVLSYASQASLNYAVTQRLTLDFAAVTAAGANRTGGSNGVAAQNYVMPHSIGFNGGGSMNYELSTRTEVGLQADAARTSNHYQGAYASTVSASLGRKMGTQWFLRASAGVGYNKVVQQVSGAPISRQIIGSGSLGYQLESHTLVASYNRTNMETNGFAVGTTAIFAGSWSWRRRGARWGVVASVGQQQLGNTGFAELSGWTVSGGSMVHLGGNIVVSTQYVYSKNTGTYLGNITKLSVNSIRLSLGWAPQWQQGLGAAPAGSSPQHQ